ncbi:hypothetical protein [Tepidibacter aestuarii]|uniref:hypothetical protein n=1 Tax=Tepidibacter aestuarii TaxID=2925782 RepID=UPI0020C175D9|nr:hypothetical protein [Tepidibacter aestuarii]CAH2213192.1 conserved protein of unknown function [Tepidibacter aestuarii]
MDIKDKQRLEKLKKQNKFKIAKKQLIKMLHTRNHIDISNKVFINYNLSESIHKKVYERIREKDIKIEKFCYEYNNANEKLEWIFNKFKLYENNNILFYPSTFGIYFRSCNHLYLDFPIAISSTIKECKDIIYILIHDIFDDLIVAEENLSYGFIISEDEYQYVSIEYWGI